MCVCVCVCVMLQGHCRSGTVSQHDALSVSRNKSTYMYMYIMQSLVRAVTSHPHHDPTARTGNCNAAWLQLGRHCDRATPPTVACMHGRAEVSRSQSRRVSVAVALLYRTYSDQRFFIFSYFSFFLFWVVRQTKLVNFQLSNNNNKIICV